MYHLVIDQAWTSMLSDVEKSVLMAKALCSYSVSETDLGHIAGIEGMRLHDAFKRLAAISFFEFERMSGHNRRVRTHLLAQDFARRVLHDAPDFETEAEQRWWEAYAPKIAQQAGTPDSENQESLIDDDLANVLERLEWHLTQQTPYVEQAARLFGKRGGLGYSLLWRGHYDDVLRVAEPILHYGIIHQETELVGQCALRLVSVIHIKRRNFEDADRYIGLAFDYNARMHDIWLEATIESVRAFLYTMRGYLSAAQQCCRNALNLSLKLDLPYDSGVAYRVLGEIHLALTVPNLEYACDTTGELRDSLEHAEQYFGQAEAQLQQARNDLGCHFTLGMIRMDRGIIARLQSRFDLARTLLRDSLNAFNSSYPIAMVYCELALVEHLSGNRDLAHSYDEQGIRLFQQIGMGDNLPPSHCAKIITTLKQQGVW
jgi:tetratricopeptide (TPR) repeat protein